jgi:hypothetical protein
MTSVALLTFEPLENGVMKQNLVISYQEHLTSELSTCWLGQVGPIKRSHGDPNKLRIDCCHYGLDGLAAVMTESHRTYQADSNVEQRGEEEVHVRDHNLEYITVTMTVTVTVTVTVTANARACCGGRIRVRVN